MMVRNIALLTWGGGGGNPRLILVVVVLLGILPTPSWAQNTLSQFNVNFVVQGNVIRPEISWQLETTNTNPNLRTEWSLARGALTLVRDVADGGTVEFTTGNPITGTFVDAGVTTGAQATYTFTASNTVGTVNRLVTVNVPGPPGPPQGLTGRGSYNRDDECLQVDLSWAELGESDAGFETVTGYEIEAFSDGINWWWLTPAEHATFVERSSLTQGNHWRAVDPAHTGTTQQYRHCFLLSIPDFAFKINNYRYRVRAHNSWTGPPHNLPSPWSDELMVPGQDSAANADPPRNLAITLDREPRGFDRAWFYQLTWNLGENNNAYDVTTYGYEVYQQEGDGAPVKRYDRGLSVSEQNPNIVQSYRMHLSTLEAGKVYSWYVLTVRFDGTRTTPTNRVTAGTPTAPTVRATGGSAQVRLDWHPGPDNGSGDNEVQWLVSYRRTAPDASSWKDLPAFGNRRTRARTVDVATAGTYEFRVRAFNRWGPGAIGRVTATASGPTTLPTSTADSMATINLNGTARTLTGPRAVALGTTAVYTLSGGRWPRMLGVTAGNHPLNQVRIPSVPQLALPDCRLDALQAIACVLLPSNNVHATEAPPPSIVRYQPAAVISLTPQSFPNGAELQVRFATDLTWIGERVAVGFHPASTEDDTVSWDGATGTDADGRFITVDVALTESPRPPHGVELAMMAGGAYRVSWHAPGNVLAAGIERYEVHRQTGDAAAVLQESVLANQRWSEWTPSDPTLVYRWYVQSLSIAGTRSDASRTVVAGRPNAPLDVAAVGTHREVTLTWSAADPLATIAVTGYRVERSANGTSGWMAIADKSDPTVTRHVDPQLRGMQTLHYRVFALRAGASSPASNIAQATTLGPATNTTATAPQNLAATPTVPAITLRWMAPADNGDLTITGYIIQHSADGTAWQDLVANTGTISTQYVHQRLDYITTVHYRVAAINLAGVGYYTPPISITKPVHTVAAPTGITVDAEYKSLTLRWPAVALDGAATVQGYRVEYYAPTTSTWTVLIADTGSMAAPNFIDNNPAHPLQPGQARRYRLQTLTDYPNGTSAWTEIMGRTRPLRVDFNTNPGVDMDDALVLYYALTHATAFDLAETPNAMTWRNTLLGPLVYPFGDAAGAGFAPTFAHVQTLVEIDPNGLGDINATPGVDANDALILYYALAFHDLLGDGHRGGFARVRNVLLGPPSKLTAPTEADLQAILRRARVFLQSRN